MKLSLYKCIPLLVVFSLPAAFRLFELNLEVAVRCFISRESHITDLDDIHMTGNVLLY